MQIAPCLRRRGLEERRDSRVDTLEIGEVELRQRVGVLKRVHHFLGHAVFRRRLAVPPFLKQHLDTRRFSLVARWLECTAFALAYEIVDERCPATGGDRENLV